MEAKINNERLGLLLRDEARLAGSKTLRSGHWFLGSLGSMILRHHRSQNQQEAVAQKQQWGTGAPTAGRGVARRFQYLRFFFVLCYSARSQM
jgi:hypothetical protein